MGIFPILVQMGKGREGAEQVWSVRGDGQGIHLCAAVLVVSFLCSKDVLTD